MRMKNNENSFMGTPDFAAMALEKLVSAGHEITLVVTQPDKEKGRGKQVQKSDVKLVAEKYDIPVFQPVKIKTEESVEILRGYEADIFVVAAFDRYYPRKSLICQSTAVLIFMRRFFQDYVVQHLFSGQLLMAMRRLVLPFSKWM